MPTSCLYICLLGLVDYLCELILLGFILHTGSFALSGQMGKDYGRSHSAPLILCLQCRSSWTNSPTVSTSRFSVVFYRMDESFRFKGFMDV